MNIPQVYVFVNVHHANSFLKHNYMHFVNYEIQTSKDHIAVIASTRESAQDLVWKRYLETIGAVLPEEEDE